MIILNETNIDEIVEKLQVLTNKDIVTNKTVRFNGTLEGEKTVNDKFHSIIKYFDMGEEMNCIHIINESEVDTDYILPLDSIFEFDMNNKKIKVTKKRNHTFEFEFCW